MSGALDTDDNYVTFGTALDPIEEEEVARKKPITISEQVATDENGRRRFHGAFTGGFSAGYYNTVGSKEGWTPSTFKSSRSERVVQPKGQNVTDFMDDEDIGAFGIAPQVLRPTDDFSVAEAVTSSRKRPKATQSDGPIPGVPVLEQIIEPVKETVGIKILAKMGWRPGQGVGPKVGKKKRDKSKKREKENDTEEMEMPTIIEDEVEIFEDSQQKRSYGCQLPPEFAKKRSGSDGSSDDDVDSDILYAPEDVDSPLCNPKENTFGLGYKGLDRSSLTSSSGHVDLFGTQLKFRGDNKNSGVTGEAFGIGAFEEPDEDVYSREDLSQYDFELETMEDRRARKNKETKEKTKLKQSDKCLNGFRLSKSSSVRRKFFPPPHLPPNFEPVHSQRKSRFETAPPKVDDRTDKRGLGRHALTVQERQVLLGEESSGGKSPERIIPKVELSSPTTETQTKRGPGNQAPLPPNDVKDPSIIERVERIKKFVLVLQAHSSSTSNELVSAKPVFKPFLRTPEKQDRYDKYLTLVAAGFQDCLKELQPPEMTEWEREREKSEFERASDIYKPLSGVMSSRFVSAKSHDISHIVPEKELVKEKDPTEDPKVAARLNLFGKLTHDMVEWHPDKLLCKRFNIKDPYPDSKFVGLRGGPSSRSESTGFEGSQLAAAPAPIAPKKSLFDNLDFSKPPPGLLPANNSSATESEPPPPGTGDEASAGQTKRLDFQANTRLEEKENIPVKASLDLFKEIFADSSESEDESPAETLLIETRTISSKSAVERSDRGNFNGKSKERDDSYKDKLLSSKDKRTEERSKEKPKDNNERNWDKVSGSGRKGIFDDLDLTKLNKEREDWNNRDSNTFANNRDREDEDDDDLLYGPRAPVPGRPLSILNSKPQSSSQSVIPSSTSSTSASLLMRGSITNKDDVVWVEKNTVSGTPSKTKKHSIKKSKKSRNKKSKTKQKEKHKKSKKHKHKRSKLPKSRSGHSDSSSSASEDETDLKIKKEQEDSDDSVSSITIHGSLDQKALLAHLKKISRSN